MASQLIDVVMGLYSFVKKQQAVKKDVMFQYNILKVTLTGIMEGLQSYSALSLEGDTQTILCLKEQIDNAKEQIMNVEKRNRTSLQWILRLGHGQTYIDDLKESIELLELAHETLIDQIDLANAGAMRSKNIHLDKLNQDILSLFKESSTGLLFWRDHVIEKAYNLPASKCANYFIEFVNTHNAKVPNNERITTENIDLIFQQLFDQDGDGRISVIEIASFFNKVWDNEAVRMKINELNNEQHKFDELEYKLLGQLCEEVNQKTILRIFKMNSFTTNQFMSIDYNSFLQVYKSQVDKKTLSQIYQKKLEYMTQKQFYERLESGCYAVYNKVVKISQTIMDAKTKGKLKLVEKDGCKYWIEDPEGGNGMCYMIKGDSLYLSYRNNWLCFSEPTKIINLKTKVTVFSLMNGNCAWDKGYMIHRFESGTVFFCYSGHDAIRNNKYQLVKSVRDQETFMGLQYLNNSTNKYQKEGEFIFIRNDMMQYKDYYKEGSLVDWNQYKKIGLEHQLDIAQLKKIQSSTFNP